VKPFFFVFLGGGIGSLLRYGISLACVRLWGAAYPWGTLSVNLLGCLLIGVFFSLAGTARWFTPSTRLFLMTGMMGGLTTFSTYGLESVNLALDGERASALFNLAANNVGGLACVILGLWLGKQL
jgi:CrcB protein